MDLEVYDNTKQAPEAWLELIKDILNYAGAYIDLPENTEMSVTLMDNEEIHQINKKYRGVDKPTDVISFAIEEEDPEELPIIMPDDPEFELPKGSSNTVGPPVSADNTRAYFSPLSAAAKLREMPSARISSAAWASSFAEGS